MGAVIDLIRKRIKAGLCPICGKEMTETQTVVDINISLLDIKMCKKHNYEGDNK